MWNHNCMLIWTLHLFVTRLNYVLMSQLLTTDLWLRSYELCDLWSMYIIFRVSSSPRVLTVPLCLLQRTFSKYIVIDYSVCVRAGASASHMRESPHQEALWRISHGSQRHISVKAGVEENAGDNPHQEACAVAR